MILVKTENEIMNSYNYFIGFSLKVSSLSNILSNFGNELRLCQIFFNEILPKIFFNNILANDLSVLQKKAL